MTLDQILAFAILGITLVMFAWGRIRHDLVAVGALVAVVVLGLVNPVEAVAGFGHPAVITVAAVLVLSRGLQNSGFIEHAVGWIAPWTKHASLHVTVLAGLTAIMSAFMNNVGALALMMPVALMTAAARNRSPAVVLMPIAFASMLGGLMTLIGTPPNIIIAAFRQTAAGAPFSMFDFSAVGVPVALLGVLFVSLAGWRLIPHDRQSRARPEALFQIEGYLLEARVGAESPLVGKRLMEVEDELGDTAVLAGVARTGEKRTSRPRWDSVREGDILLVKADPKELKAVLNEFKLELMDPHAPDDAESDPVRALDLVEAVVSPGSTLEGRGVGYLRRRSGFSLKVIAIARPDAENVKRLRQHRFETGDVALIQASDEDWQETLQELGMLPLPERDLQLGQRNRPLLALGIFAAALALASFNILPVAVAFLGAILAYAACGILQARELYRHIDWPIIVLLAALIPVGHALEVTGGTGLVADLLLNLSVGLPAWSIIAILLVITMCLSDIINNAATAVVMAPIGIKIAAGLDASPDPFLMAIALGASCAYLTPIGHQSNLLVMGPGGYRFGDYWRMGLPLEIAIVIAAVPLIMWAWPL